MEVRLTMHILPERTMVCLLGCLTAVGPVLAADPASPGPSTRPSAGFSLEPVQGSAIVTIFHSAFPGQNWCLHIPEHAFIEPGTKRTIVPSQIGWERFADSSLAYRCDASPEDKKKWRL